MMLSLGDGMYSYTKEATIHATIPGENSALVCVVELVNEIKMQLGQSFSMWSYAAALMDHVTIRSGGNACDGPLV